MRAAIFRNGQIVAGSWPEPKPGAGQVLVKTLACGICGSDLHARKHAHRMVELAKHIPRPQADGSVARHRVRPRVLLRGAGLRPGHGAQAEARHKSVFAAGAADAGGHRGHRLFQRQCRRLCRAHAAQRALAAGSAERTVGRACRADRAARGRRPRGGEGQHQGRRGAAGDRLRPGGACGDRGAQDQGPCTRSSRPIIRRRAARLPRRWAPTSWSIPRARSLMRPGPSTPRCRRRKRPRVRRCRRCCRR